MEGRGDGRHGCIQDGGVERLHEKSDRHQPRQETLIGSCWLRGERTGTRGVDGGHSLSPLYCSAPVLDALRGTRLVLFRHCLLADFASLCIAHVLARKSPERCVRFFHY